MKKSEVTSILKDVILVIPAIHILASFVYLFFYYYSFGAELAYFSSPSDILAASLSKLGPIYLFFGIGLLIGLLLKEDTKIEKSNDTKESHSKNIAKFGYTLIISLFVIMVMSVIISYLIMGYPNWAHIQIPTALVIIYFGTKIFHRSNFSRTYYLISLPVLATFLFISFSGLEDGQYDRKISYADAKNIRPSCSNHVVLKNISDKFLVVKSNQSRAIVDSNCDEIFLVIPTERVFIFSKKSAFETIVERFTKLQ